MSEPQTQQRTCRYPGCHRRAEAATADTGRPPEYCDDRGHNRAAAWRARQRVTTEAGDHEIETRPVDAARQRAGEISSQVTGMAELLAQQLDTLLGELRTLADPEAVEAQLEWVSSDAAEQTAAANARAARAEQAQHRAEAEKDEADAAATDATSRSAQLSDNLAHVSEQLAAVTDERDKTQADLAEANATAEAQRGELNELRRHVETTEKERDSATERAERGQEEAAAARAERDAATERTTRAEEDFTKTRTDLDTTRSLLEETRERLSELRGSMATLTAERDSARTEAGREREYAEQRVTDLRTSYDRQIEQLRADLDQTHIRGAGPSAAAGDKRSEG